MQPTHPRARGTRSCREGSFGVHNSPMCTLSQNDYGADRVSTPLARRCGASHRCGVYGSARRCAWVRAPEATMSRLPLDRALASDIAAMHLGPTGRAIAGDTLTITGYATVKKGRGARLGPGTSRGPRPAPAAPAHLLLSASTQRRGPGLEPRASCRSSPMCTLSQNSYGAAGAIEAHHPCIVVVRRVSSSAPTSAAGPAPAPVLTQSQPEPRPRLQR